MSGKFKLQKRERKERKEKEREREREKKRERKREKETKLVKNNRGRGRRGALKKKKLMGPFCVYFCCFTSFLGKSEREEGEERKGMSQGVEKRITLNRIETE